MNNVNPNSLNNLADALSPDITRMNDQELLAEVAEDYGDSRAFVRAFDRAQGRARRQVQVTRFASLFNRFLSWCQSVLTLQFVPMRPAMVSLSAALVAIVAVVVAQNLVTDSGYVPLGQVNPEGSGPKAFLPDGTATATQPPLLGVSQKSAQAAIELGDQLLAQGRMDEAVRAYNKALLEFQQLAARDPGDSDLQVGVMQSLYRVSTVSNSTTARALLAQALAVAETLERKQALPSEQSTWPQIIREAIRRLN